MFCGECGTKNKKGDAFCKECGSKLESVEVTTNKTKKEISGESFRFNIRKGKLDFNNYFNQFRNRQKFINIDF